MRPRHLLLSALALVVVACGGGADPGGGASAPDGSWQLVEGNGPEGSVPVLPDHPITLTFEEDGRIGGTAACNHYFAEATVEADSISIAGVGATEMGCSPMQVMEAERAYLETLPQVTTFERTDDRLVLSGPDTELVYERLEPPATAELVDTRWELDSLIHGDRPDGAVSSAMAEGYLILHEDGVLVGSTGCRDLSGEWIESEGTIRMASLAADGECPADHQAQDTQVVEVLERFRAEVDGQRLTLTKPDGSSGLGYRAGE